MQLHQSYSKNHQKRLHSKAHTLTFAPSGRTEEAVLYKGIAATKSPNQKYKTTEPKTRAYRKRSIKADLIP
jgi:hypothetical protein